MFLFTSLVIFYFHFVFYYFFCDFSLEDHYILFCFLFVSDEVFADKVPKCPDCEGVVKPG